MDKSASVRSDALYFDRSRWSCFYVLCLRALAWLIVLGLGMLGLRKFFVPYDKAMYLGGTHD